MPAISSYISRLLPSVSSLQVDPDAVSQAVVSISSFLGETLPLQEVHIQYTLYTIYDTLYIIVYTLNTIKALASEKRKKIRKKIKKIVPVPIYVFVDSEQKAEFKAKIKPCSHQLNYIALFMIY